MKRLALTLAICLGCFCILEAQNIWKPINVPGTLLGVTSDGSIFAYFDYFDYGEIARSQDEGETWQVVLSSETEPDISFLYDREHGFTISEEGRAFVVAEHQVEGYLDYYCLFYSDDNGDTWQNTAEITELSLANLAEIGGIAAPTNDIILVWTTQGGFAWTLDSGANWNYTFFAPPHDGIPGHLPHELLDVIVNASGDLYATYLLYSLSQAATARTNISEMSSSSSWQGLEIFDQTVINDMEYDPEGNALMGYVRQSDWTNFDMEYYHGVGYYVFGGQTIAVSDNGVIYKLRYTEDLHAVLNYSLDHGENFFDVGEAMVISHSSSSLFHDGNIYKGKDNHLYFHGNGQYWKSVSDADHILNYDYFPLIKEGNQRQKWNVVYLASMNYPNDYFTEIQSIRDNITLDGVDYKLVWRESVEQSKRIAGAVREEDKRVYYRMYWQQSYQDEVLLYDFNLTVGDTVTVNWMGQQLMVMEESEVEVNGTMRRQLGLAMYFGNGIAGEVEEYWIEGVGSTYGFLNSGYEGFVGSFVYLLCYHENGNLIWDNVEFDDCVMNSDGAPATFAPQGAEWYFNLFSFMNSPITYYRMAVEGDTLIQGHQCSVITRQYLGGNGDKQYVYEENNKVYWYNATLDAFTTLYDFDAEEGESWICHIDSCSYEVTVQSVEQVTWGGRTYRVQNIASVEGEFYERIIEGIGSVKGLFPYPYACVGDIYCGPYPDYLRCYLVDGEMLYHEGDLECDAVLPWQYPCWDGTVAEAYNGGNGTAEDPYQIATPQQLALLAQQTNDGTGGDAYYLLTDDICLNANLEMWYHQWIPIGRVMDSTVAYFRGHFDGNGKTISKLLIETNELMTDPVIGLFGCTDGAEIVNVNLSDCRLTGGEYAGGLVGYAGSTDISNCSVQNSQITTTGGVAGGIVGYAGMPFGIHETNENVSKITNCEINCVTVESVVDAGGIVGKVNDDSYYARYLVSNCNANNEQYYHVKGSVSGGIVGEMRYGTVEGCASNTIVVGTGQVINVCTGGIAGSIHGSGVIANSYNRGNVVADFEVAGGIVGYSAGNVYNVYNAGEVVAQDPNGNGFGTIVGNVQAGERLNCYWLESDLPSAGNPILPDMPGSTSFHQGSTSTSWVLDEAQYGTMDLVDALNAGANEIESLYPELEPVRRWKHDDEQVNGGFPVFRNTAGMQIFNGSEWYYEILNDDGSITYQYLYQAGDTVVHDEPTHILVKINTLYDKGSHQEVTREYVYERDGKVYWWNKTLEEFTVLYDLGAQEGDSWVIKVGTESLTMHVDAVNQYYYEDQLFRMLIVSDDGDLFSGTIVCGVGHLSSFFPERLMTRGKGYRVNGLRCYWNYGNLAFTYNREDCTAIYANLHIGVDESTAMPFALYPNPTDGVLFVETQNFASLPNQTYRISNLMGQTVLSGTITAETQQIDVAALPKGMYFITVGETTRKFVVR